MSSESSAAPPANLAEALAEIERLRALQSREARARVLAQEALDESQDRLRMAVEAAQLALWEWDVKAGKVFLTERWGSMLGDEPAPSSSTIDELFARVHPEDVARVREAATDALSGRTERYVTEHRVRGEGGWIWIESRGLVTGRDAQDRATRMIGTNAVISERKEAQQQMQQARELAEQASRTKSEFVIQLGRHLRLPIDNILERMRLLAAAHSPSERTRYLEYVEHATRDLGALVNDVVEYASLGDGHAIMENKSFELRRWLRETLAPYAVAAQDKGLQATLRLEGPVPDTVLGDPARLGLVLSNLLGNAVKFTARGEVELAVTARPGSLGRVMLRFEVSDTGAGIEPALQARIFDPFSQGHVSIREQFGGTGLGLALCDRIVRLMGGRLKVTSLPRRGSIFAFELDMDLGADGQREIEAPPADFTGLRVLVAEDHAVSNLVMRKFLGHLGAEVAAARNGRDAIYLWARGGVDLILMDVEMPDVSGIQATQDIRRREAASGGARTPIIAITAHVDEGTRQRCLGAGMDAYLAKPVTLESLAESLKQALKVKPRPAPAQEEHSALNPAKLLERLGGDKAALAEIAATLRDDLNVRVPRLHDAMAQRDRKAAHLHAHALKGALDIMTAARAAQLAKGLETAARKQAWDLFQRAMPLFDAEVKRVHAELAPLVKNVS